MMIVGDWYISIFNDEISSQLVRMVVSHHRRGDTNICLNDCWGQGVCDDGVCRCHPMFGGQDCSKCKIMIECFT